ncbi:MAG TPA: hypothetical protein ENK82_09520 [Campylobacterales bacterium]|nr:hypothetical protein [Campylobacterales bacterium]
MLNKNRYFDIIRDDVFTKDGHLKLKNYLEEFEPYAVSKKQKRYANFGEIKLLEFNMKGDNKIKDDTKFQIKYQQAQAAISNSVLHSSPILQAEVSEDLGYEAIPTLFRNLTYGDSQLSVWFVEGYTYVLVNTGLGESICNLLFFCRVEEPKV